MTKPLDLQGATAAQPVSRTLPDRPASVSPTEARRLFAAGLSVPTTGWSAGHAQANIIALPRALAFDMMLFAQRNPKPCPILDVLDAGEATVNVYSAPDGVSAVELEALVGAVIDRGTVRALSLTAYDPERDGQGRVPPIAMRLLGALAERYS